MVFYHAKGGPDSCGQGCSEWIAAEGRIDLGTAQRLRAFLTRLGKRELPIFFDSPGGIGKTAMEIGRLLRERKMTASVYRTIPTGCAAVNEQACRTLKQSGQTLPSQLRGMAPCNSACVFALIGAKTRQVPPGARLGVHSVGLVHADGSPARGGNEKAMLAKAEAQARRYVQEMGVDVRLFDIISKVPHEKTHYLSRDEIARFGIDHGGFQETRWSTMELVSKELRVMKFFVEPTGDGSKGLRTGFIEIGCGGLQRVKIIYFRGVTPDENRARKTINLAIGDRVATFLGSGSVILMEAIETGGSFNILDTYQPFDFIEAAATHDEIEITEHDSANASSRVTRLSTAGMAQATSALRQRCIIGQ